jgi:hypothetical protein
MKKLIAIGISTLTAATFAFGAAPAHAEDPIDSVIGTVCDVLGETDLGTLLADAVAAETAADAAVADAEDDVLAALTAYVNSVVATLNAVEEDGDVPSAETIMNANFQVLVNKVVAWSAALTDQFEAHQQTFSAELQTGLLDGLTEGLTCLPVDI